MRTFLRILAIAIIFTSPVAGFSQWQSFKLSPRGDTLNRVDLKGRKQGPWVNSMPELRGEQGYEEQGYYLNDQKDGLWKRFSLMGDKIAEENYRWGALDGKQQYYDRTGGLIRVERWRAIDPEKTMDTVDVMDIRDPTKVIDRVVVKLEGKTVRHGQWTYYDAQWGNIDHTENYFMDKLRTPEDEVAVDDELKPLDPTGKTAKAKEEKKPQAILDYEKKNSGKKKIKSRDGRTGY